MTDGRFAIIDPVAGISGDMMLGALVAAGAPAGWLQSLPERLGFPGVTVNVARVDRCGISATKVDVCLPDGSREQPSEVVGSSSHRHAHDGDHQGGQSHHHNHSSGDGAHRHIGDMIALVERANLTTWVRERAARAFRLLGEAEGHVHGMPAERVPLHEVGAVDAVIDIVGAIEGFEQLGITKIYNRPLAIGSGWVRAEHGVIPVPAPATAILLEGMDIGPDGPVVGEATTPTGAVLLKVLSAGAPPGRWRAVAGAAWGAGGRNPSEYPNALRLIVAEEAAEAGEVVVLSTDVDDLSPEYLDPMREALFLAGALDVQVWTTQMKKGRAGFRVEATVGQAQSEAVSQALFRHSTTAGIRRYTAERATLARREVQVTMPDGSAVRVKVLDGPDGPRVKPEYEDVAALARRTGRPAHEVARDLQSRALRLVSAEQHGSSTPNEES